jgi:NAD/NADP transhydrogenase beta subunit
MKIIRFRELSKSRKGELEGNEVNVIIGVGIDIPIACDNKSVNSLAKSVSKAISFFLENTLVSFLGSVVGSSYPSPIGQYD